MTVIAIEEHWNLPELTSAVRALPDDRGDDARRVSASVPGVRDPAHGRRAAGRAGCRRTASAAMSLARMASGSASAGSSGCVPGGASDRICTSMPWPSMAAIGAER